MRFDFLTMSAIKKELAQLITGARVQRIYQPQSEKKDGIIIYLYHRGEQSGLLLSCNAIHARIHLTRKRHRHLEQPSPFCMLLRKYLTGAGIKSIRQLPMDRIMEIDFKGPEGLPDTKLVAEIMGRRSNIILLDSEESILGAVKTAHYTQNPLRPILPGEPYRAVPPQEKADPLALPPEQLADKILSWAVNGFTPEKALLKSINGISPLTAKELFHRSGWNASENAASALILAKETRKLFQQGLEGIIRPCLHPEENIYAPYELTHLPHRKQQTFETMNELIDNYYHNLLRREEETNLREKQQSAVRRQLNRLEKKLVRQEKELNEAEESGHYRVYGEALLAYGTRVKKGAEQAVLPDPYHPGQEISIPLNPAWRPEDNAQKYFERYRKAKKGRKAIAAQIKQTRAEIEYCQSLSLAIEQGDKDSLEEVELEMKEAGYLRKPKKTAKQKATLPKPAAFMASSGRTILVGMNNRQNDYLTFKVATRRDTWFHVKNLPGGHVVLKDAPYPPSEEDLFEGALLAAYFSRGRENSAVDVDYTQVRHVRRGPGGKPGFALYENQHTITVNPSDPRLKKLLGPC